MEKTLIYRIACVFYPAHPTWWLADRAGVCRSTAKTWAYGSRQPPIEVCKDLLAALVATLPTHEDRALVLELWQALKGYIWKREWDGPVKRGGGFNEVRVREPGSPPRDGRNRRGRRKRK
jgi:hypothetical protein